MLGAGFRSTWEVILCPAGIRRDHADLPYGSRVVLLMFRAESTAKLGCMTPTPTPRTTTAFFVQAGIAFALSFAGSLIGIAYLPIDPWQRGFLCMTLLFLVTSTFTLAKVVRDHQEASTVRVRVDEARLEKLIAEHDPFKTVA